MMKVLWGIILLVCHTGQAQSSAEPRNDKAATPCLGPEKATKHLIYLHGYESAQAWSHEESENRTVLEKLASIRSVRIALPQSPFICKNNQRCWASSNGEQAAQTFTWIQEASQSCWHEPQAPFALLGFSNGGYFAFKLYKFHKIPELEQIVGVGSSGLWDASKDKLSPHSSFHLIMGRKDITLPSARKFEKEFQKSQKDFRILLAPGGHHLDLDSLLKVFP